MLPSEFTPEDMRVQEYFIKGTEPTEVSSRYSTLPDVTNLRMEFINNQLILKWDDPVSNTGMSRDELYNLMKKNNFFTYDFDNQFNEYYSSNGVMAYDVESDGQWLGFVFENEANVNSQYERDTASFTVKSRTIGILQDDGTELINFSNGVSINVNIKDLVGRDYKPEISLNGSSSVSVYQNDPYSDKGATAKDDEDGNLTSKITKTITGPNGNVSTVDTTVLGTYSITYTVSDSKGQKVSITRKVIVKEAPDTTDPIVTLTGSDTITLDIFLGDTWTDPGATALDNKDGDLTSSISVTDPVDDTTVGTYTVTYSVTDAAGNTGTTTRTVEVVNTDPDA
jgi:hypothetical protein